RAGTRDQIHTRHPTSMTLGGGFNVPLASPWGCSYKKKNSKIFFYMNYKLYLINISQSLNNNRYYIVQILQYDPAPCKYLHGAVSLPPPVAKPRGGAFK